MIPSPTPKDLTVMIFLAFAWWLLLVGMVRVMPVLETPAVKNPFCRRSGRNQRSGRERRMSVDFTKYSVDRRSGVDRRKGQDRRKHDYWNTNHTYWNTAV
jgi:hypothetical protein